MQEASVESRYFPLDSSQAWVKSEVAGFLPNTTMTNIISHVQSGNPETYNCIVQAFQSTYVNNIRTDLLISNPESYLVRAGVEYCLNFTENPPHPDLLATSPLQSETPTCEAASSAFEPLTETPLQEDSDVHENFSPPVNVIDNQLHQFLHHLCNDGNSYVGVSIVDQIYKKFDRHIDNMYAELSGKAPAQCVQAGIVDFFNGSRASTAFVLLTNSAYHKYKRVMLCAEHAALKQMADYIEEKYPKYVSKPRHHRKLGQSLTRWLGSAFFIESTTGSHSRLSNNVRSRCSRARKTDKRVTYKTRRIDIPSDPIPASFDDVVDTIGSTVDVATLKTAFESSVKVRMQWLDTLKKDPNFKFGVFSEYFKKFPNVIRCASLLDYDYQYVLMRKHIADGNVKHAFLKLVDGVVMQTKDSDPLIEELSGDRREHAAAIALVSLVRRHYGARGDCEAKAIFFGGKDFTSLQVVQKKKLDSLVSEPAILITYEYPDFKYWISVDEEAIMVPGNMSDALHYLIATCYVYNLRYSKLAGPFLHFIESACGLREPGICAKKLLTLLGFYV